MGNFGPWDSEIELETGLAGAESDIDDLEAIHADTDEPTGFVYAEPDTLPVTLTFVNGTRTLTVAPSASTFSFYIEGVKFTKSSSETIQIDNTEGLHHIYYDADGSLAKSTTFSEDYIMKFAYVAAIYWDATNSKQISLGYECHGCKMDGHTHELLHETFGAQIESGGGGIGDISADDSSPDADSTKFSITQAAFWDEDIKMTHSAKGTGDTIALYYKSGADASNIWRVDESTVNMCLATGTVGENRAAYNQNNGGTWQLTECTDNYYVLAHVFAFNDRDRGFGVFIGQNQYSSKLNAREGAITEIGTLDLRGFLTQEIKLLGTIIVHTKETYSGNAIYSRVVTTDGGEDFIDWRNSPLPQGGTSSTVTDHGALGGLDDTDHPASAIFTDTTNFNSVLSAADTTVQAALDTLDNLDQSAITSGSASATITADGLDITDGSTSVHINISSGDLIILNSNDGGDVYIKGEVATDTEKTIFKGAPDGAAELYYAGVLNLATTGEGISFTDGVSGVGYLTMVGGTDLYLTNSLADADVYITATQADTDAATILKGDPDGAAELYYAGGKVLATASLGIEIHRADATTLPCTIQFASDDIEFINTDPNGKIIFKARNTENTETRTLLSMNPDGGCTLRYENVVILSVLQTGISITDGTATAATIGFSEDDLIIANNDPDGVLKLQAEKTGTGQSVLFSGDPDGAAELYYAGTKKFETTAAGISFTDGSATAATIEFTSDDIYFVNNDLDGVIYFQVKKTGPATYSALSLDGANFGRATLFYNNVAALRSIQNGVTIGNDQLEITCANNAVIENSYDGGTIEIRGEVATNTNKTMALFNPAGAAQLYHAGVLSIETNVYGADIYDSGTKEMFIGDISGISTIYSYIHGQRVAIQAEDGGGQSRYLFIGDPDAGQQTTIYRGGGSAALATTAAGISITDGTATAATIGFSSDDLIIANNDDGGHIHLQTAGTQNGLVIEHDGAVTAYFNATAKLKTTANGITVGQAGNDFDITAATAGDTTMTNEETSGWIYLKGQKAPTPTKVTMAGFDPDGAAELYYAGVKKFETTAAGISIQDGTYIAATIGFSSDDLLIKNNDPDGVVYIYGRNSANTTDELLWAGDPDGSSNMYYDGAVAISTQSYGFALFAKNASNNEGRIGFTSDDFQFNNVKTGGTITLWNGTDSKIMFKGYPAGAAELYYAGVKKAYTNANGIEITDGTDIGQLVMSANDLYLDNFEHGGWLYLRGQTTGGAWSNFLVGDADAETKLYRTGSSLSLETHVNGISIYNGGANQYIIYSDGSDEYHYANYTSGRILLTAKDSGNTQDTMAVFDPDGAAELYHTGVKKFETTAAGISITDGTATAATIGFSADDLVFQNNDAGGNFYFYDSTGADGFGWDTNGFWVGNVSTKTTRIYHDGSDTYIRNRLPAGGDIIFTLRNALDSASETSCKMIADGAVELYYDGVLKFSTDTDGVAMVDAGKIVWDDAPASDLTGSGDQITVTVDQNTVGVGGILRKENAGGDGNYDDGDKDAAATAGHLVMAVESGTGSKKVMLRGFMRNDTWAWTPGQQLFLGDSGAITNDVSGYTTGDVIQVVGYAHTATVVYFNPSVDYTEV